MDPADVEMEDATSGFEPEVSHSGYDVNLVRHSGDTVLGLTSLVTAQENQLLDEDTGLTRAPGTGTPGTEEESQSTHHQEEIMLQESFLPWHHKEWTGGARNYGIQTQTPREED